MSLEQNYFGKSLLTAPTLASFVRSDASWESLLQFHGDLVTDDYVRYVDAFYRKGREDFGSAWDYMDLVTVLYGAAKLLKPKIYLEIGTRRGRSVCAVARGCPEVAVISCDMWQENYAGMENPGPEFVKAELAKHGHKGSIDFLNGDSHVIIPQMLEQYPDLQFDLITVDGDHTEQGAADDLATVIPRLAEGGVLVFDDITHPHHPYLLKVWREQVAKDPLLTSYEYGDLGYGVAFAIKGSNV